VRKIILLEDAETYLEHLRVCMHVHNVTIVLIIYQPLQQDPRVVIIPKSAATWTTFHHLKEDKLLEDTPPSAWDAGRERSNLTIITQAHVRSSPTPPLCEPHSPYHNGRAARGAMVSVHPRSLLDFHQRSSAYASHYG
jgi:hypothetical protein